ncbi:MAG: phage tail sheath family protein, partial [bacterium]|nr:phage tail sheath family protein [bacterium]
PARLDLDDVAGRPSLSIKASSPGVWGRGITAALVAAGGERFSLSLRLPSGEEEFWHGLTTALTSLELLDRRGRPTLGLSAYDPRLWHWDIAVTVTVDPEAEGRFSLELEPRRRPLDAALDGSADEVASGGAAAAADFQPASEIHRELSMLPADDRYAPDVLNAGTGGSLLVTAADLHSVSEFPDSTPNPLAPNLKAGIGRLVAEPRNVQRLLNHPERGSRLVEIERFPEDSDHGDNVRRLAHSRLPVLRGIGRLAGGGDGLATLAPAHLSGEGAPLGKFWGLETLEKIDDVAMVAMPDLMPKEEPPRERPTPGCRCETLTPGPRPPVLGQEFAPHFDATRIFLLQSALVGHCRRLADRMAILDPPPHLLTPQEALDWRQSFDSSFAALYYPWLRTTDPLRLGGLLRTVPPGGHVAGVYARSDLRRGVHQPPANELVEGARDVAVTVDEIGHGYLNESAVNLIRPYTGRGLRVMGARTLSSDTELRFVNVRRLLLMIVEALDEQVQWLVMEPNRPALWRRVERVVGSFLLNLWRRGMLDGATRKEAYFVRCDETTNPPEETEVGRLVCVIGILPPWPAEFIIVRIGRSEGSLNILDVRGRSDA